LARKTNDLTADAVQAITAKQRRIKGTLIMKITLSSLAISAYVLFAIATMAGASPSQDGQTCCAGMMAMQPGQDSEKSTSAKQSKGVQKATITINNGYSPSSIKVKKGSPVELTFVGGKNIGCGGTVVFKSLKISKSVAVGKSVVIKFTPTKKGEIPFTCGMGMLSGKVVVI
jgi:Cu+-exporting ATPase